MSISRNRKNHVLTLNQSNYMLKILNTFEMFDCKPTNLPIGNGHNLDIKCCENDNFFNIVPYVEAIGILMYVMVCTRPDIGYVVSILSKFMMKLKLEH